MIGARPRPFSLRAYRAAAGLGAPLARSLLEARARRGKEDPARLGERLGHASAPRPDAPLAWLHAISVGESLSLLPLIGALASERPDLGILVTSGTRASAEILARRLPPQALHQYAPVDTPGAVGRFLAHWRPDVGIFVESELWPNLILAAREAGVKLALVSARMTQKSARAWRARPAAVRSMLESFELILAQDAGAEDRLTGLGARVAGRLNLKQLGDPLACDPAELARLRAAIGGRPVVVAVSTHATEEALIVGATAGLDAKPLTILVPRHPERGVEIATELAGRRIARRSCAEAVTDDVEVYVADTLDELGLFLRVADLAVMGGGFARGFGGHNPLEPARLGRGVVSGPIVFNHADAFAGLADAGGARLVGGAAELARVLTELLADRAKLAAFNAAALAFAERQGDQLGAGLDLIRPLLPAA
jgi:3-deoxy-D-manno-octulosonic-acid transferase